MQLDLHTDADNAREDNILTCAQAAAVAELFISTVHENLCKPVQRTL